MQQFPDPTNSSATSCAKIQTDQFMLEMAPGDKVKQ